MQHPHPPIHILTLCLPSLLQSNYTQDLASLWLPTSYIREGRPRKKLHQSGHNCVGNMHHRFVHCTVYTEWRCQAGLELVADTEKSLGGLLKDEEWKAVEADILRITKSIFLNWLVAIQVATTAKCLLLSDEMLQCIDYQEWASSTMCHCTHLCGMALKMHTARQTDLWWLPKLHGCDEWTGDMTFISFAPYFLTTGWCEFKPFFLTQSDLTRLTF